MIQRRRGSLRRGEGRGVSWPSLWNPSLRRRRAMIPPSLGEGVIENGGGVRRRSLGVAFGASAAPFGAREGPKRESERVEWKVGGEKVMRVVDVFLPSHRNGRR